jgi:hypothetical protein
MAQLGARWSILAPLVKISQHYHIYTFTFPLVHHNAYQTQVSDFRVSAIIAIYTTMLGTSEVWVQQAVAFYHGHWWQWRAAAGAFRQHSSLLHSYYCRSTPAF